MGGIADLRIDESPIAVIDFETTGMVPGVDRVVEVSIVRKDPGQEPKIVLDTLINPLRTVSATEIHGITDDDVADAPKFFEVSGDIAEAISGCVVAAYNVYFDLKFLSYELNHCGCRQEPPHFCLMYMRPMLGLGKRCKLDAACKEHGIEFDAAHIAGADVMASVKLLDHYLQIFDERGIGTYGDLTKLKTYKFFESFDLDPLPGATALKLPRRSRFKSRLEGMSGVSIQVDPVRQAIAAYWDSLKSAVSDLEISDDEVARMKEIRKQGNLSADQVRAIHARAFANVIAQFVEDRELCDSERRKLKRLHQCLRTLGWAPGE